MVGWNYLVCRFRTALFNLLRCHNWVKIAPRNGDSNLQQNFENSTTQPVSSSILTSESATNNEQCDIDIDPKETDSTPEIDTNENEIVEVETSGSDTGPIFETDAISFDEDFVLETEKVKIKEDQILKDSSSKLAENALLIEGLIHEIQGSKLYEIERKHSDKGSSSGSEMVECPDSELDESLQGSIHEMTKIENEDNIYESEDNRSANDSSSGVLENGPIEHVYENGYVNHLFYTAVCFLYYAKNIFWLAHLPLAEINHWYI